MDASEDPERYLAEHAELLRPEITTVLREQAKKGDAGSAVFVSILDLARRGESELAFQATKNPTRCMTISELPGARRMSPAWLP